MVQQKIFKGYLYTILATLVYSNVYVFSKAALNQVALPVFLFFVFLIGFCINLVIVWKKGKFDQLRDKAKKLWWLFPLLGGLEIFTVIMFYASINAIKEPAVTGFLGNLYPLFTTLLGIAFLNERFTKIETLGIVIAFLGALLTSYSGNLTWKDFFIPGAEIVVVNALGAAAATAIVRAKVNDLSPEILSFNRTFWLLIFASGWMILSGTSFALPANSITTITIAAILDPVLAILLVYKAFQYIEASRGTIIQSLKGLIIIPVAWLYFGTLPLMHQIIGGLISMVGVTIIATRHSLLHRKL